MLSFRSGRTISVGGAVFILIGTMCIACNTDEGAAPDTDSTRQNSDGGESGSDTESDTETEAEDEADGGMTVSLVIDDFEDGDHVSLLETNWVYYDDGPNEGLSEVTISLDDNENIIMDGEGYESDRALTLSYELDQGDWIWEPYIGWYVEMGDEDDPYDATEFGGLAYAYKGSSHFVYVYTYDVTNFDYYRAYIPESEASSWITIYPQKPLLSRWNAFWGWRDIPARPSGSAITIGRP